MPTIENFLSKGQQLVKQISTTTRLPHFLENQTTKGVFFTEIAQYGRDSGIIRADYLAQHGIYFLGQIFVIPKSEIKTFIYEDVQNFIKKEKTNFLEESAELFSLYAKTYHDVEIGSIFSSQEIDILREDMWDIIDPTFSKNYHRHMRFGDKHYRALLRMVSPVVNRQVCVEYRKLHLLKFSAWVNKTSTPSA